MISVIIPTYRRYTYLRQAVQSVIQQNYSDIEIIIIDDHSGDETKKISKDFPQIHYIENDKNKGPGYSRKMGLKKAQGEYIVFLDDDDYYTDNSFFHTAVDILEKNSDYVFVSANADELYVETGEKRKNELNVKGQISSKEYLAGFVSKYKKPLSTFTTIFRKSCLIRAGVLEMKMVNDMAIYLRVLRDGNIYFLERTIGIYRIHKNNISKNISADFLLDNLKEKHEIYSYIKENSLLREYDSWWLAQIETTVSYYVYGSRPALIKLHKIYKWCCKHSDSKSDIKRIFKKYNAYLIDYNICDFKVAIKRLLGRK